MGLGEFELEGVYIEYLKLPNKVTIGGYNDISGGALVATNSDLPSDYHTLVVDIAVQEASRILEDSNRMQLKQ